MKTMRASLAGESEILEKALVRCAAGDESALRVIYDAESGRMLGVAMRILKRRSLAEDCVHDAFLQVWRRASTFDPQLGSARSWLYAVLRHRALNILRDENRSETTDDIESYGLVSDDDPEASILQLSEVGALRRCLDSLDEKRRNAIVLAYIHGLSHSQLASRLRMPLGTVKSWIRRSLAALKECLK